MPQVWPFKKESNFADINGLSKSKRSSRSKKCRINPESVLLLATILGVILGVIIGVSIKLSAEHEPAITPRDNMYLSFLGDMFLRMLKLLILPLITSTLISNLASRDSPETKGKIGLYAAIYYFSTTISAVILGIILVLSIKPGVHGTQKTIIQDRRDCPGTIPADTILDLLRNMVPTNIVGATLESERTCVTYVAYNGSKKLSFSEYQTNLNLTQYASPYQKYKSGMNILGLVVFSLIFGAIINKMGPAGYPLADFFKSLEGAMMRLVTLVIWFSPVGIMFLIAARVSGMDDLLMELKQLGMYMLTVIVGLLIHGFLILPGLLFFVGKRNPFSYIYGMLQAYCTALGTASSSATMPLTLKCLEDNNKIDRRVSRFVIPLGATINMDGTALYEAVAAIYISQTQNISLSIGEVILVSITATLASIGAAGIPEAGLVTMIMVLIAVGLDPALYSLIIPVDWLLDRIRTMINVHGDSVGAAVVERFVKGHLEDEEYVPKQSFSHATTLEVGASPLHGFGMPDGGNAITMHNYYPNDGINSDVENSRL